MVTEIISYEQILKPLWFGLLCFSIIPLISVLTLTPPQVKIMLQKKERQIKTVVFNRLYFLTSDLLFDFLQRIQPVLLRRPEHKMLNYIFTIYLAQWILDREDFTIAWFLFLYLINMGVLSDAHPIGCRIFDRTAETISIKC